MKADKKKTIHQKVQRRDTRASAIRKKKPKMIYTIEKRKLKDCGSLVTRYDVVKWEGTSRLGLFGANIIERFETEAQAQKYCEENHIEVLAGR